MMRGRRRLGRRVPPPPAEVEVALSSPPGWSGARFAELCDALGDDAVRQVLTAFRLANQERLTWLRSASEATPSEVRQFAHELHGAAASVGAEPLRERAVALGRASRAGADGKVAHLLESIIEEMESVEIDLAVIDSEQRVVPANEPEPVASTPVETSHPSSDAAGATERQDRDHIAAGSRVLLVDDAAELRLIGQTVLANAGYSVDVAVDGRDALERIRDGDAPDLVVLDVQMPGVDGWETLAAIRSNPATERLPVVLCTVRADPQDYLRACRLGADAYIAKSYAVGDFVHVVTEVAERTEQERSRIRKYRAEMTSREDGPA